MKYYFIWLFVILNLIISGCNTIPNRNFTGSPSYTLPYATVLTSPSLVSDKIYISEIDGHSTSSGWPSKMPTVVDVTHGKHSFKFIAEIEDQPFTFTYSGTASFDIIQGITYKVTLEPIEKKALPITNISSLQINENISPNLILDSRDFNNVSELLLYWGLIKKEDNLYSVLDSQSKSNKFLESVESHLANIPHYQAIQIINVTKQIVDKIEKESDNQKKSEFLNNNFVVRDISNNSFITSIIAAFDLNIQTPTRFSSYNTIDYKTYQKKDKELPKIDFSQHDKLNLDKFKVDTANNPTFDMPKTDMPTFDVPKINMPKINDAP
ncbi:MAG: hypothetical protein HQK70_14335 [Desulfamplus sp.]|nr:hypothetical protein [Desulfamplus sp.]